MSIIIPATRFTRRLTLWAFVPGLRGGYSFGVTVTEGGSMEDFVASAWFHTKPWEGEAYCGAVWIEK